MIRLFYISALLLLCSACNFKKTQSELLRKMEAEEILNKIEEQKFNYAYATFKNERGQALDSTESFLLNTGKLTKDYYSNPQGEIKEVVVRKMTLDDQFLEIQIRELYKSKLHNMTEISIDCYKIDHYLSKLRNMENALSPYDWTSRNLIQDEELPIVVSIIEQCGFPDQDDLAKEGEAKLLESILYGSTQLLAYYYPELKRSVQTGKLKKKFLAVAQDRLLSRHGFKQLFGTQILRGKLRPLEDPSTVNKRRNAVGLSPIEPFLAKYGISFDKEIRRLDSLEQIQTNH